MTKSNQSSLDIADHLSRGEYDWCPEAETRLKEQHDLIRQQQAEMEELEKENTDLRYLIATKLEQQDGISLNSMAHPITNTPEPSYEIDPDKLETIEIDLPSPEPVAWIDEINTFVLDKDYKQFPKSLQNGMIPLYTHPAKTLTDDAKYNVTVKWDGKTTHHANVSLDTPLHYNEPKTLTDEEITKLWSESHEDGIATQQGFTTQQHYFAHLILRKAQENG